MRPIHRYNCNESRYCEDLGVPYQRNGFLFDSVGRNVHDQVRNMDFWPLNQNFYGYNDLEGIKLGLFLKVSDPIIVHYQQGYLRAKVAKITTHRNVHVYRYDQEGFYLSGREMIKRGFITKPFDPNQWKKYNSTSWQVEYKNSALGKLEEIWSSKFKTPRAEKQKIVEELKRQHWSNPRRGKIITPRTADRQWRLHNYDLYAIPKERSLYLKLKGQ